MSTPDSFVQARNRFTNAQTGGTRILKRYDPDTKRTIFTGTGPINVIDNNGLQFLYDPATNTRWSVDGPGAKAAINALWGEPVTGVYLTGANRGDSRGTSVLDLYGGPNQIEAVIAGRKADPLTKENVANPREFTTRHGVTISPLTQRDFLGEIKQLMPYLPAELAEVYAREWEETGDPALAEAAMRQSPAYQKYYPGNRRQDGTIRLTEAEYTSTMDAYKREIGSFGVPPNLLSDRYVSLIENEVSPNEFRSRLANTYQGIVANAESIRNYYAANFGNGNISDAAIFASALTAENPLILQQRIANAQIGGTAASYGFDVRVSEAERLRTFGMDQAAAQRFYAQAQSDLPKLNEIVQRANDPDDEFTLSQFTDAIVVRDADDLRRLSRLLATEASLFSTGGSFASDQSGRLTGLR